MKNGDLKKRHFTGKLINLFIPVLLILFFSTSSLLFSQETGPTQEDIIFEDGHIGIKLDKIEKADSYPSELKVPGQRYPSPREGYAYVVVYFTIEFIRDIHVVSFGGRDEEKSVLHNGNGKQYGLFTWNARGWEFLDPGSLASPSRLVEGATGILIFEIPAQENLAKLSFVYYFKESWDDEQRQKGEFNINLGLNNIE